MFKTLLVLIYFVGFLLYTLSVRVKVMILNKKGMEKEMYEVVHNMARMWGRQITGVTGSKVTVSGEENIPKDRGVVFIANHQSYFDVPVMMGYVNKPLGFITKVELSKIPIFSMWLKLLGCVFIVRNDAKQSLKAINQGAQQVKSGNSMVIFPEGTRSVDGKLGEFKPGSLKLAVKSGAPIVPVVIKGTINVMNKKSLAIKAADVEIIILPPIMQEEIGKRDTNDLAEQLKNIIMEKLA
ncbi:MAG: lysophospholipid acyltransferase family protein [Bacillota bacterium]|nr:lysophospholipid acyltransferase family protein [Bacillota bacterium]